MEKLIVYLLNVDDIKNHYHFVYNYVSKSRKEKADKYKFEQDRLLSLGAGYFEKKFLPNEEIKYTKNQKPYLEKGPFFNISHSGNFVAFTVSEESEIGIDIEIINEKKLDGIKYVLKDEEKSLDIESLFRIWTNKESIIKCLSTNIGDIKTIPGSPLLGPREFKNQQLYTTSVLNNGYSISTTRKGFNPFEIEISTITIRED